MRVWHGLRTRIAGPQPIDRLIVGLGNPSPRFEGTRHNLGREAVELLADRWAVALDGIRSNARYTVVSRRDQRICLAVPIIYMNESGRAVAPLLRFFKLPLDRLIVAVDDLDLPLGSLRLRKTGGTGGHKGLASISRALGTESYARLRIGIGRPPPDWDPTDYVLAAFDADDRALADAAVQRAADALEAAIDRGLDYVMNAYNG